MVKELDELELTYDARREELERIKDDIVAFLDQEIGADPRIDRVHGRVKATASFLAKARRKEEDGSDRYAEPLKEILDQVAVRVVVKFLDDVRDVEERVRQLFDVVRSEAKKPERPQMFDYEARHLDLFVPRDLKGPVPFFEMQVCTLFQHAWAEANHDLGYKGHQGMEDEQTRLAAWAAASAWGADRAFNELRRAFVKGAAP